ncbi:MAG: HAMP domain-containing protein [Delftia acidovorans]|jgi:signal transduction histidine kinase|nr:HAMP domain-containing protein [Delftia acidovorans]
MEPAPNTPTPKPTQPPPHSSAWQRLLPRTLFGRVTLVIVLGLALAQLLAFAAIRYERGQALQALMMDSVEREIATTVALLDRLPAAERPAWLPRLERRNYRLELAGPVDTPPPTDAALRGFADALTAALQPYPVKALGQAVEPGAGAGSPSVPAIRMQVQLGDGSALYIVARRVAMPVSGWVAWALLAQLLILVLCAWQAVRLVTRPLARLAAAADSLGADLRSPPLQEQGPAEVRQAALAFNAMQQRIAAHTQERVEILAAISHDLQTPLTRMRLRTELMDDAVERDKFQQDLEAMRSLVHEGIGYARSLHGTGETPRRLDLDALLHSMVSDYADTGMRVQLQGRAGAPVLTRPQALRRILGNLIDNALKFGSQVQVQVHTETLADGVASQPAAHGGRLCVTVLDDGPGIPAEHLQAVFKPFFRVEGSRSRDTGGTGLGLSIASQLAAAMGAELTLANRPEGGLAACLRLPPPSPLANKA